jgi:hypothetical protein
LEGNKNMGIYKDMYYDQGFGGFNKGSYKKEGYKKEVRLKPEKNPDDYMTVQTSAGNSVSVTRCVYIDGGLRCNNPGTMNNVRGWVCGKHYRI